MTCGVGMVAFVGTWQGVYRVTRYLLSNSKALAPTGRNCPLRSRTNDCQAASRKKENSAYTSPNWNNKVLFQGLFGLQEKIVLRKFAPNFYMSAVQCENYFLLLSRRVTGRHIESVFTLSLIENVAIFNEERAMDNTHFLYRYSSGIFFAWKWSYLFKCGVIVSSISLRVRHNLQLDRRNRLHTFSFLHITPPYREPDGKIEFKFN